MCLKSVKIILKICETVFNGLKRIFVNPGLCPGNQRYYKFLGKMFSNSREIKGLHFFLLGTTMAKINYLLSKSRISLLKGIDGAVPRRVTEIAAVAEPKRTASISGIPSARA